jgi:hypothetical protein
VTFIMRAADEGEGGIMALIARLDLPKGATAKATLVPRAVAHVGQPRRVLPAARAADRDDGSYIET